MNCQDLERLLYPYLDGEFDADERLDVESHLATCAECARQVHAEARLKEALRRAARHSVQAVGGGAPDRLRAGLQAGMTRELRRQQGVLFLKASAAALVLVAAGSGAWWVHEQTDGGAAREARYVEDAVRRHARQLPLEVAATSPEVVEQWFDGKLDHRVRVPRLPHMQVEGARISNVSDRQAALIRYSSTPDAGGTAPRRVSLLVVGDSDRDVPVEQLPEVQVEQRQGHSVVVWRDAEIVYLAAGDLDEADIRSLLQQQARGGAEAARDVGLAPAVPGLQTVSHQPGAPVPTP